MAPACRSRGVAAVGLALGFGLLPWPVRATPQPPDDELTTLLAKVYQYADQYQRTVASLVSEERYEQRVITQQLRVGDRISGAGLSPDVSTEHRVLLSDYLLVKLPGVEHWQPFRDVHTVDGRAVRDREARLERLFISPGSANPLRQADEIRFESRRYNIGDVVRDINVPTYAVTLLRDSLRERFAFRLAGRDRLRGLQTRAIAFEETGRPTVIRGRQDGDSPARGRLWVDPQTGTIVQTRLETSSDNLDTRIEVVFELDPGLGFWVPMQMTELHTLPGQKIEGKATYSNFRQFRVETTEVVDPPRQPATQPTATTCTPG